MRCHAVSVHSHQCGVPMSAVPPKNNGEASALMNQTRNIGSSIGISFGAPNDAGLAHPVSSCKAG